MVTSNGNGPFCFSHQQENIERAGKEPVFLLGGGYGKSLCHVCLEMVSFFQCVIESHMTEGRTCDGSSQEIAAFRVTKKGTIKWQSRK
jgi:hypothetical protein